MSYGIYKAIDVGAAVAFSGSIVALATGIVTGDPNLAFGALGLGMAAEAAHYTATVGKAMTTVPDAKEGLESKLDSQ